MTLYDGPCCATVRNSVTYIPDTVLFVVGTLYSAAVSTVHKYQCKYGTVQSFCVLALTTYSTAFTTSMLTFASV